MTAHELMDDLFKEQDKRLTLKPVEAFNTLLRRAFPDGPCTCVACKDNGGSGEGYVFQHTFQIAQRTVHRVFTTTTASDVLNGLKKAWLAYHKLDLDEGAPLDLRAALEFVDPRQHEHFHMLLRASGVIKETPEGILMIQSVAD